MLTFNQATAKTRELKRVHDTFEKDTMTYLT